MYIPPQHSNSIYYPYNSDTPGENKVDCKSMTACLVCFCLVYASGIVTGALVQGGLDDNSTLFNL
jgi:hypothetical protein